MLKLYVDDIRDAIKGNQKAERALNIILAAAEKAALSDRTYTRATCRSEKAHKKQRFCSDATACQRPDCFDCNFEEYSEGLT